MLLSLRIADARLVGIATITLAGCASLAGLDDWEIAVDDAGTAASAGAAGSDASAGGSDASAGAAGIDSGTGGKDASSEETAAPECEAGAGECVGPVPRTCSASGHWQEGTACEFVCAAGKCGGTCKPASKQCSGNLLQTCSTAGTWDTGTACPASTPLCKSDQCVPGHGPSCDGLAASCGPAGTESCCAAPLITGGTFKRSYDAVNNTDASHPATVSDFRLDKYEVTVGRFRRFVAGYPGNKPATGSGKNPHNPADPGWQSAWTSNLPADKAALIASVKCEPTFQTWTDQAASHESLPVNCVNWFVAHAFCIWDGGRLPTEAEWNYAAAGGGDGSGQRVYPWSNPPTSSAIDTSYALYKCLGDGSAGCTLADILVVGSRSPKGDGRWGHSDLAGGMWEWALDYFADPYPSPCNDCASMASGTMRILRGGGFDIDPAQGNLLNVKRNYDPPSAAMDTRGMRCARSPD